jgi:NuA3 HAT complex component NTO1
LVLDNAVLYNKEGTAFHKTALRIRVSAQPILADLDQLSSSPNLRSTEQLEGTAPPWTLPLIGDLEPPLEILELLLSVDAIDDDSELILSADPITSLFNFEFEKKKLPPPNLEDLKEEQKRKGREERREKDRKKRQVDRERKERDREKHRERRDIEKRQRAEQKAQGAREASNTETLSSISIAETTSAPPDLRVTRTRGAAAVTSQAEASTSVSAPRRAGRPHGSTNKNKGTTMSAPVSQISRAPVSQASNSIPAPGEIPLVEHVDERGSFTLFEQGWILPAGQKRGVRLDRPAAPPPAPPPNKRMRLGERLYNKCLGMGS